MKAKFYLFFFLMLYASTAFSQAENNNWYYGQKAHLRFDTNNNTVSVLLDNNIPEQFSSSSGTVSNKVTGELLFTTDGKFVYDKNLTKMPNSATGAINDYVQGQGGLIVPSIANRNLYYVFSPSFFGGLFYSVIDMSLRNGLGDIDSVIKGIPMKDNLGQNFTTRSLAITVVPNDLGDKYWILYPTNNNLYTYEVNSNGFNTNPVQVTPLTFTFNQNDYNLSISRIKASPDGKRIGITVFGNSNSFTNSQTRFYTFDKVTGKPSITNEVAIDGINIQQFEFSPSLTNNNIVFYDSLIYGTIGGSYTANIYGRDLNNPTQNSLFSSTINRNLSFQRTPTNEIYFATNPRFISTFSNPNSSNSTIISNFLDGNPDINQILRYAGIQMPQLIPKLDCSLYEDLKGINITNSYSYQVSDRITTSTDYAVNNGQNITFFANNYIEFKANTHVKNGATVLAKIQTCPTVSNKTVSTASSTSTENIAMLSNQLIIIPNPANSYVNIKTTQIGFNKITINSLDGKVIKTKEVKNDLDYDLEISQMAQGIYVISVETNNGEVLTKKLVKN